MSNLGSSGSGISSSLSRAGILFIPEELAHKYQCVQNGAFGLLERGLVSIASATMIRAPRM